VQGGTLIASGFTPEEAGDIERMLREAGFSLITSEEREGWVAISSVSPEARR
jgi:ribosomal protein L11 methylase PrmA